MVYSSFWHVVLLVIMQGEEQPTQTVDGLLQALGLQKYAILFKAEEVCISFIYINKKYIILIFFIFIWVFCVLCLMKCQHLLLIGCYRNSSLLNDWRRQLINQGNFFYCSIVCDSFKQYFAIWLISFFSLQIVIFVLNRWTVFSLLSHFHVWGNMFQKFLSCIMLLHV